MTSPSFDRRSLEAVWLQRVNDARLRLESARNHLKELLAEVPFKEIENADGQYAYRKAVRLENCALREYARVLRIFTDLTVNGVVPDESEWLKARGEVEISI